ncbi:MAG: PorV/PorQ family protein [Elusimicrobia bacterium]|nr:PorV/PorQ family protein [Elusimicrobiota bacterium]MBD3411934.1 PorV/PorQ family protein [Elusimicrobiota bacterium]
MKKILIAFCISTFSCYCAYASDVGVTGAQFLKIGTGARPMGMGGAFTAVSDDGYASYWNPSGFARLEHQEISSTFLNYFEDVKFGFVGYARPIPRIGVIAGGVTYLTLDDIERRTGDTETADGTFGADDVCTSISYAQREPFKNILPDVDLGVTLKFISQKLDDEIAQTGALDCGALYHTPISNLDIGMSISNIGPGQKFISERDPLPLLMRLGGAYRLLNDTLLIASDLDHYLIDQKLYAGLGCEYWLLNMIGLRAGYRHGYHTDSLGSIVGLTGGVSLRAFNIQLDYAFVPFGELGDTHRFSLSAKF